MDLDGAFLDRGANAFGGRERRARVTAGKKDQELFPAVATDIIIAAQAGSDPFGDHPQDLVAGRVSAGVVDALEMVDVDERDAERRLLAAAARDLLLEPIEDGAAVPD